MNLAALLRGRTKQEFTSEALTLLALCSFAVAQPVYSLLSGYPEFFLVRRAQPTDLLSLVLVLTVLTPVVFIALAFLAQLVGRRAGLITHRVLFGLLTVVFLLPLAKRTGLPHWFVIHLSIAAAVGFSYLYHRVATVHRYFAYLSPAALLFPLIFLFTVPISGILFQRAAEVDTSGVSGGNDTPVVMVIFDEIATAHILQEDRTIDSVRYPNFAALAKNSHWFRNSTTVNDSTTKAVPCILSGLYYSPAEARMPVLADYPHNLFTMLQRTYRLNVTEPITTLSPSTSARDEAKRQGFGHRIQGLLTDVAVVFLHITLPEAHARQLPDITLGWGDFAGINTTKKAGKAKTAKKAGKNKKGKGSGSAMYWHKRSVSAIHDDRPTKFRSFIERVKNGDSPSLNFNHTILPHPHYMFLPSGKSYGRNSIKGLAKELWDDDEWAVTLAFQQYLLQMQFADRLLGELVEKLKAEDLYDRSLIIVTADHGVSFIPGDYRRPMTDANRGDILAMPLLIKTPGQKTSKIFDHNVETIDILPTIADVLEIETSWKLDGHSLFDAKAPARKQKTFFKNRGGKVFHFDGEFNERFDSMKRMHELFGSGSTRPRGLQFPGGHLELADRDPASFAAIETSLIIHIKNEDLLAKVELASDFVPALVEGRLTSVKGDISAPLELAVALNGKIVTTARTFKPEGHEATLAFMLPEGGFRQGKNELQVFQIVQHDDRPLELGQLQSLAEGTEAKVLYQLDLDGPTDQFKGQYNVKLSHGTPGGHKVIEAHATNHDPHFLLPAIRLPHDRPIKLVMDLHCPKNTEFQVFYSTHEAGKHSEAESIRRPVKKGRNRFSLVLPGRKYTGRIRIDPGRVKGRYLLRSIKVIGKD